MTTESPPTAQDILDDSLEGKTGTEVANNLRKEAREVEEARKAVSFQIDAVAPGTVVTSSDAYAQYDAGLNTGYVAMAQNESPEKTQRVVDTLNETAADIASTLGGVSNNTLENGIAGQAYQGQAGSSEVDIGSAVQEGNDGMFSVDTAMLEDVKNHELRHEQQAATWNAESVDIGRGDTLSRTEVSEYDSMSVQTSIAFVSSDYKKIYSYVAGLGVSQSGVAEVAENGDLEELGARIRKIRGEESPEADRERETIPIGERSRTPEADQPASDDEATRDVIAHAA